MKVSTAGLMDNVEDSAARLTRRVVQNATDPIRTAGLELIDAAIQPATALALGLVTRLISACLAVIFLVTAIALGSAALFTYLANSHGRTTAFLVLAALYGVLAGISVIVMMRTTLVTRPAASFREPAPFPAPEAQPVRAASPPPIGDSGFADAADALGARNNAFPFPDSDELVAALGEAGLAREKTGLQAGLALARRLTPLQLALIGAAAGFVGGRRMQTLK